MSKDETENKTHQYQVPSLQEESWGRTDKGTEDRYKGTAGRYIHQGSGKGTILVMKRTDMWMVGSIMACEGV
eukprot:8997583-Ditylum_brightwellii.AAC.1